MRAIVKRRGQVTIGGHHIVNLRFTGRISGKTRDKTSGKLEFVWASRIDEVFGRGPRVDVAYDRLDVKAAADVGDACFAYFCEHGALPV